MIGDAWFASILIADPLGSWLLGGSFLFLCLLFAFVFAVPFAGCSFFAALTVNSWVDASSSSLASKLSPSLLSVPISYELSSWYERLAYDT